WDCALDLILEPLDLNLVSVCNAGKFVHLDYPGDIGAVDGCPNLIAAGSRIRKNCQNGPKHRSHPHVNVVATVAEVLGFDRQRFVCGIRRISQRCADLTERCVGFNGSSKILIERNAKRGGVVLDYFEGADHALWISLGSNDERLTF